MATQRRVAVTGLGAVSAAGPDVSALVAALDAGKSRLALNQTFDLDFPVSMGKVEPGWHAEHDLPDLDSPTGRLCLRAARDCTKDAKARGAAAIDGLVVGTSTGGQSGNEETLFALLRGQPLPRFDYRKQGCMAAAARLVATDLDIRGPVQTISTACTSSTNAIALGALWIQTGRCRQVLVGGGDALCHTTLSGFHILQLTGPKPCTPFGPDRPGMTLGEGAGFLMLEDMAAVRAASREALAELLGFGLSGDAHHMTAPPNDGSGAALAMQRALEKARLVAADVDHVNAHGTGTELNDAAEAQAIDRVFGADVPVMSCKGIIGHTLGGAGGLEAVVSVVSAREKRGFENTGTTIPAEECPVTLVGKGGIALGQRPVVISNSFAFGGNNGALIFRGASTEESCG